MKNENRPTYIEVEHGSIVCPCGKFVPADMDNLDYKHIMEQIEQEEAILQKADMVGSVEQSVFFKGAEKHFPSIN